MTDLTLVSCAVVHQIETLRLKLLRKGDIENARFCDSITEALLNTLESMQDGRQNKH